MDESGKGRLTFAPAARTQPRAARGAQGVVHLPTWSRLNIAARQWAPAGNGGDFFEIIQQQDGRVSAIMADVSGNGPSAAGPVGQPALGDAPGDRARAVPGCGPATAERLARRGSRSTIDSSPPSACG